jgi:hypothetical protein
MTQTAPSAQALPLFYVQPRVLQPGLHGQKSLSPSATYQFAARTNAAPLVASEFAVACHHYPIVFTPHPVAVLGLRDQDNAFVDADGKWRDGSYVPAYIRRYPFIFVENESRGELTLCIDEAATHLVDGRDAPLFDEDGKPTALTQNALLFCRDYQGQHLAVAEFAEALQKADLLVENRADVTLKNGETLSLSGFQVIDEARFNQLPDEEFLRWRKKGWLPLVYAHFFSVGNWAALVDRTAGAKAAA